MDLILWLFAIVAVSEWWDQRRRQRRTRAAHQSRFGEH